MSNVQFTPEEISVIDKKLGFIVFDWAKNLINHIISEANKKGISVVYMNTTDTLDSGNTSEEKVDYFYERLPPQLGFKAEKVNLRGNGQERLWAYRLDVVKSNITRHFFKLAQTVALENIPAKYQGAFISIFGRKTGYTKEEIQKVISILESRQAKAKPMSKFYYDWNSREWAGAQRFDEDIIEKVVIQKMPNELQEYISNDPVLLKFWSFLLSQQHHFDQDAIGFALISPIKYVNGVRKDVWLINEIQTDCINAYQKIRRQYRDKESTGKMTWETLKDILTANNRGLWINRIEGNEPLKQEILNNPKLIDWLPYNGNIEDWIDINKKLEIYERANETTQILNHLASNFNTWYKRSQSAYTEDIVTEQMKKTQDPKKLFDVLKRGKNDVADWLAARNPYCPPEALKDVLVRQNRRLDWVSWAAAENPNCPPEILANILENYSPSFSLSQIPNMSIYSHAAMNPSCPSDILGKILKYKEEDTTSKMASENPNAPAKEKIEWLRALGKIGKENPARHIIEKEEVKEDEDLKKLKELI